MYKDFKIIRSLLANGGYAVRVVSNAGVVVDSFESGTYERAAVRARVRIEKFFYGGSYQSTLL